VASKLRRELTLWQVVAMAAGGMIAAWMVEIKYWFELSGSGSVWALLTTGVLVIPLALVYSEMSSMLPLAGGENVWVSNAFSWDVGWFLNWALFLLYLFALPNVAYGIVTMIQYYYPLGFEQIKYMSLIMLFAWYVISNFRVGSLGQWQNVLFWSMVLVGVFVGVVFVMSPEWQYSNLTPWFPKGLPGFGAAVGILVFKYIGFDMIPQLSEEANFPRKDQWKAYMWSTLLTFVVYGLAVVANAGIVSLDWIAKVDIVDPRVADLIGQHYLAALLVTVGILGTLTTLTGFWLAAARTLYGAAEQRQLPGFLTKLNKQGQPAYANIVVVAFAVYFAVVAPPEWVEYMYTVYSFVAGLVYMMVSLAFLRLRKTRPEWDRPFKVQHGMIMGGLSFLFTIWVMLASISQISVASLKVLGGYFALGALLYAYAKYMQRVKPDEWRPVVLGPEHIERD